MSTNNTKVGFVPIFHNDLHRTGEKKHKFCSLHYVYMREWETNSSPPLISLYHTFQASPHSAFKTGLGWKQKRKPAGENEGMGRQKAWSHWFQYTPWPKKTEAWKAEHSLGKALMLRSFLLDLLPSFLPLEPIWFTHTHNDCLYSGKVYLKARLPVGLQLTTGGVQALQW